MISTWALHKFYTCHFFKSIYINTGIIYNKDKNILVNYLSFDKIKKIALLLNIKNAFKI